MICIPAWIVWGGAGAAIASAAWVAVFVVIAKMGGKKKPDVTSNLKHK